jgi:hypothetical protein
MIVIVTGVISGVAAGALLSDPVKHVIWPPPDPIAEQFDDIRKDAVEHARVVVEVRKVALHPPTESYFVRTQPRTSSKRPVRSSDSVIVYDEKDGELKRKYWFRPLGFAAEKRHRAFRYISIPGTPSPRRQGDLDRDGTDEVVGYWRTDSASPVNALLYPSAITWDAAQEQYVQRPLLRQPAKRLPSGGATGALTRAYRKANALVNELHDQAAMRVSLYGATALAFAKGQTDLPVLLAGFVINTGPETVDVSDEAITVSRPRTVLVDPHPLDFQGDAVNAGLCEFTSVGDIGKAHTKRPVGPPVLWRQWERMRRMASC